MLVASQAVPPPRHDHVADERVIVAATTVMSATLTTRSEALGVVALLHASSAARFGRESKFAAEVMAQGGMSTIQVDLLNPEEDGGSLDVRKPAERAQVLSSRISALLSWLREQPEIGHLPVCLFATPAETLPALLVAERDLSVVAVASRGGVSDGEESLGSLRVPTLLLLGKEEQERAPELAVEFFVRRLRCAA